MQSTSNIFHPLKPLSSAVMVLLGTQGVIHGLQVLLCLGELYSPYKITLDTGESASLWIGLVGLTALLQFPIFIVTIVLFLKWEYWAYKNLGALRAGPVNTRVGWVIGFWFLPLAQLIMPFLSMREIWKQSDPDIDPELRFFPGTPGTPVLLIIWWVLWLASSAAANVSFQMEMSQAKPDDARLAASFGVASLLTMLAAVAAIMVVGDITERQTNRAAKIQRHSYSEEPPPPPADFED